MSNRKIVFEVTREHCDVSTASSIGITSLLCLYMRVPIFTPSPPKQNGYYQMVPKDVCG